VKIKGMCSACGRDFMAEQVVEAGGRCPWCGTPFQPDYAVTLVETLRDAENAGAKLERAFEVLAELAPGFTLDERSVTGGLAASISRLGRRLVRHG
jgi:hypothetical protein